MPNLDYDDFDTTIQVDELIDYLEQQELNAELFEIIERESE